MAWAPDYCTTDDLKSWMRITHNSDDTLAAIAITTSSRAVDGHCGRQFGSISSAVTRYYRWDGTEVDCRPALVIDDLQSTTDLSVTVDSDGDGDSDGALASGTDFDLWPSNAVADGLVWTRLVLRPTSALTWSRLHRSVAVTARFGWTAVPTAVKQATLILSAEFMARRNAPFGIAGSPEFGSEMRLLQRIDPNAFKALAPYRRLWAAA